MTFESLGLAEPILKALKNEGYEKPTPIQSQAIPVILNNRDLIGCAQTGTGKTAAFAIPIIQHLYNKKQQIQHGKRSIHTLVLTPTRELAIQIDESFKSYGRFAGLHHTVIFGGVNQHAQTIALRKGVDILTATPGRLLDLMEQGYVDLRNIEIFVLDEADRMLDMGFIHDVKKVIAKLPANRQTLFFSATMPDEIVKLSKAILTNPLKVEVTPPATTAQTISQSLYYVEKSDKKNLLAHILNDSSIERALVFTKTKHGANKVAKDLMNRGIKAEAIHGNKSQNARQLALKNFKEKSTRVLVATDIAARGIDVDDLTHVINYEIPNIAETYVHRIGRTGRAGASGTAISFCESDERAYIKDIQKLIGLQIPVHISKEFSSSIDLQKMFDRPKDEFGNKNSRSQKQPRSNRNRQSERGGRNNNRNRADNRSKPAAKQASDPHKQNDAGKQQTARTGSASRSGSSSHAGKRPFNESRSKQHNKPSTQNGNSASKETPKKVTEPTPSENIEQKQSWLAKWKLKRFSRSSILRNIFS